MTTQNRTTPPPPAPARSDLSAPHNRLLFLDAIRGIAASLVFVYHAAAATSPAFAGFSVSVFDLGKFGVALFFLCSGFVIPISLEAQGSFISFWVRRLLRLLPLYGFSIAFAMTMCSFDLGCPRFAHANALIDIAANLTFAPTLLGSEYMLPLYWTLSIEMLFYIVVSVLFFFKVHQRTALITTLLLCAALLVDGLLPLLLGHPRTRLLSYLGQMFVGTAFYRFYAGQLSRLALTRLVLLALLMEFGTTLAHAEAMGEAGLDFELLTARVAAYPAFALAFLRRHTLRAAPLIYLGLISYSIYLMHPLGMALAALPGRSALNMLLWGLVVLALSSATYAVIERPAIQLGRRLTKSYLVWRGARRQVA